MSNIRGVHVLAEFPCPRCGGAAISLAIAGVHPDGRLIDPSEHAGGRQICSACRQADKDAGEREYQKRRAQSVWARKAAEQKLGVRK